MTRTVSSSVALLLFLFVSVASSATAGELGPPPKKRTKAVMKWTVKNTPIAGAPGEIVKLELYGEVPAGYYTYSTRKYPPGGPVAAPPTFSFEPKDLVALSGDITYTAPKLKKTDEGDVEVFEKDVTFTLPLKIAATAAPGEQIINLLVDSQVCDEKSCIPSFGTAVPFTLNIGGAKPAATPTPTPGTGLDLKGIDLKGLGGKGFDLGDLKIGKTAVKWTVKNTPLSGARGELLKLELHGEIPSGHYTYPARSQGTGASPTVIKPVAEAPFKVDGTIVDPPTKRKEYVGLVLDIVEHEANFTVPIRIATDSAPGAHNTKLVIDNQVCTIVTSNDDIGKCIPSNGVEVTFVLNITDAPPIAAAAPTQSSSTGQGGVDDIATARQKGLWAFLKLSMLTGFLALLTPCVFPMIPITVSFFTKRKQATRGAAIRDAGFYAVGIICAFVILGFLFTFLMGATGVRDFATNPWANIVVAIVFMALAFSLFGAYEIQLPTSVMNALNKKAGEGEGVLSVLLMGVVFALTSFTCTVPFVGAVLVTATQGDLLWPAVGMLGFATVFALPFLILAVIPALLKSLPKSGGWLNSVKVVMGFLEIAAALKFISNVDLGFQWGIVTREFFLAIWIALTLMIVFYLLGKFQMTHDSPVERIGAARATLATAFLGLAVWMTAGLFGMKLGELDAFIPPRIYPGTKEPSFAFGGSGGGSKVEKLTWIEDYDVAVAEAKRRNVPLFLDFTGDQCTNCRLMEENIFPKPEIQELLSQFVLAKLVTDRKAGPDRERSIRYVKMQEERFQTASLPFYVILSPDDKVLATFDGLTRDASAYAAFLRKGGAVNAQSASAKRSHDVWGEDLEAAMAEAKARNIPVFVDITADNCMNCRMMENSMFPRPEVDALLNKYVRVKLFTDRKHVPDLKMRQRSIEYSDLQVNRFKSIALPTYAILSPNNEILAKFEGSTYDAEKYVTFLKRGIR